MLPFSVNYVIWLVVWCVCVCVCVFSCVCLCMCVWVWDVGCICRCTVHEWACYCCCTALAFFLFLFFFSFLTARWALVYILEVCTKEVFHCYYYYYTKSGGCWHWRLCVQVCGIKSSSCPTWLSSSSCPLPTSLQRPRVSQGPKRWVWCSPSLLVGVWSDLWQAWDS